ncbi:MAG TPA: hypothetical protein VLH19_04790 [Patescibacteria group bacterium]|nr:hypothetical protein [Patescibacteria group bacterium]
MAQEQQLHFNEHIKILENLSPAARSLLTHFALLVFTIDLEAFEIVRRVRFSDNRERIPLGVLVHLHPEVFFLLKTVIYPLVCATSLYLLTKAEKEDDEELLYTRRFLILLNILQALLLLDTSFQ